MKLILKIIGGVLVLLLAGLVVFIATFDVNKYKPEVITLVKEKTGRNFDISGDFKMAYSLIPTVAVDGVSFGNSPWGSRPDMAKIGHFEARIALLPLLNGNLHIRRLVLSDTDILLETSKDGTGNWVLATPPGKEEKPATAPSTAARMPSVEISNVWIENSKITYKDGVSGKTKTARIDEFKAATGGLTEPLTLSLKAAYNDMPLAADGSLGSLSSLTGNQSSPLGFTLKINDVLLNLAGTIEKPLQAKGLDVDLKMEAPSLDTLARLSEQELPKTGPLRMAGHVSEKDGNYLIKALTAETGKLKMNIDGQVAPGPPVKMALSINLAAESLADLNDFTTTKLPDLKPLSLASGISNKEGGYQLNDLKLKVGNSDLAGNATVNVQGKRPALAGNFNAILVDLVPFTGEKKKDAQQPKKTKVFSSEPLLLAGLKAADINMNLKAKQIKTADLVLDNVYLALSLVNGKLAIKPLTANTGGGTLAMQMNLDAASGETAAVDTSIEIKNFEPSTLPDLKDEISGGKTDVTLKGKGSGNSVAAIMAGLNGSLLMKMGPGILKSSKANAATSDMLVSTYQLLYPGAKGSKDTQIQCGVVNFNIKDGIASTDKGIAFATNKMNIVGSGIVDLKTEKLDIGINPQAREGVGISAAQLAELVRVGGTLAEPKAVPDTMAALKTAASVGTALSTGGLSLILGGLSDKSEADPDPCATALGVKSRTTSTTTQKEEAPKSTTEKAVDTVKETGSAIGEKLKGLFK